MDKDKFFADFQLDRVLLDDAKAKLIAFLGQYQNHAAIVSIEKTAFNATDLNQILQPAGIANDVTNDVYHKFFLNLWQDLQSCPAAKMTVIWPATETHILKYTPQRRFMIEESPELYERIVAPYIETMTGKRLDWVYNILNHKAESERIVYEDADLQNGYIMLPDLKWDGKTLASLYFLCIVHRRDLKSLRDLTGKHLDLLNNIKSSAKKAICDRYDLQPEQLRCYIHYQPSYYHLHVHVQTCDYEAGEGLAAGKAILLDDVIEALRVDPAHFSKRTIFYTLGEQSELYQLIK